MHRVHVPSKRLTAVEALAALTLVCGIGMSCVVTPDSESRPEEVDEAQQAATTCVTIQRGQAAPYGTVEDAHIASDALDPLQVKANKNYGSSQVFTANVVDTGTSYVERYPLVRWDVSGIPANSRISSATATLTTVLFSDVAVDVYDIVSFAAPWSESSVTWNSFWASNNSGAYFGTFPQVAVDAPTSLDLTFPARVWQGGPNNGVFLYNHTLSTTEYRSSEWTASPADRPALDVCYHPCTPPTISYETRPYFGGSVPDTASAIAAFNAAPPNQPGYGSATLTSLAFVSNQYTFGGYNGSVGYHALVTFDVPASDAGVWQIRAGIDYGLGGTLLVDGVELDFRSTDMWWNGSFSDPTQYLAGSVNLGVGTHTIESYGFEGCCDGPTRFEVSTPTSGGFVPVTTQNLCL